MKSQKRNLNPTPEAAFAMSHWHNEYAAQGGGSMDFYDNLPEVDKRYCKKVVERVLEAHANHK